MPNILEQIESKYPVEQITANGEQVWPYLRIRCHFAYVAKAVGSHGEARPGSPASQGSRVLRTLRFYGSLLSHARYGFRNWFGRYDYLVLTDGNVRRQMDGRYHNRLLDPIVDQLGPGRTLCIETTSPFPFRGTRRIYTRHVASWSVLKLTGLAILLLRRVLRRKYNPTNRQISDSIETDLDVDTDVAAIIEAFEAERKAYSCVFRLMRPKALLLTCYYAKEPAIRAAKDLGIKVVEVQHGAIGKEHPAYNVRRDIDRSCFPDHLLVFGRRELATFDNSRFIDPANVHPVGSYYIDYVKDNYSPDPDLSRRLSAHRKVVGVTLQWTFEKRLIAFICEAAKLDGTVFYLLIPREPESEVYRVLNLPTNITVMKDKNFYELMAYCDFHSTVNSTCAVEAPALGVQNILVDIDGAARAYYEKVLDDDRITRFAATPEEYVDTINSFSRLDRQAVCKLHEGFFAPNYRGNIRNFVKTHLS